MPAGLKVFEWSDGFHRFTVATTSRPKALAAWGMQQDIFASGLARQVSGAEDAAAALERPGQVIERGLVVDVGKAGPRQASRKTPKGPSLAQRRRIDILADRLQGLEREHAKAEQELREAAKALDVRTAEESRLYRKARARLARDLEKARGED